MRPVVRAWSCCLLLLSSVAAFAQPAQPPDWRQSLPAAVGTALAQAPNGDLVVAGFEGPSAYDPAYGAVMTLQRYSASGVPVWATPVRWPSPAAGVKPTALTVDADGNTIVLGAIGDYNFVVCVPEVSPCTGATTIFNAWWLVQKYSPAGVLLWERRQLLVGFVPVRGVADAAGDLYIVLDPHAGGRTTQLAKLSAATGATVWTASTIDGAKPGGLALTPTGSVVLAGSSIVGLSISEYAAADGARLTRTAYTEAAGYYAPAMAVGPQGQIAVTGRTAAGLFVALESASRQPVFATTALPGGQGKAVAIDGRGAVVVAGTIAAATGTDWALLRLDGAGVALHGAVVVDRHPTAAEAPADLVLASDGAAYVTGAAGPGTATDPAAMQAVTVRLAASGTIDWVAVDATGRRGVAATVDAADGVAVLAAGGLSLARYAPTLVNQPPVSAIRVAAVSGLTVTFDASASVDPDGAVAGYRWTFGDGVVATTTTPSIVHAYGATGAYTASVVAVDALGAAGALASTSVAVVAPATPTAFTLSAASIRGGSRVTGRVTLSASTGAVVTISSSRAAVASVPASITVAAGQTSASVTISTSKVRANTAVTITVTANGVARSAVLTVLK